MAGAEPGDVLVAVNGTAGEERVSRCARAGEVRQVGGAADHADGNRIFLPVRIG